MPLPWEQDYDQQAAPAGAKPWERDYIGAEVQSDSHDFFHPEKPAPGSGWRGVLERIGQYPRIFAGEVGDAFHTLGGVAHGQVDPTSPEAAGAAATVTGLFGPRAAGQVLPELRSVPSGLEAAQTAVDIGSPLPAGIASQTPGVQAFTQGFRQVPFVGPSISEGVQNTVRAAGSRVGDIAEDLSGGPVADRATVGASTKSALQDAIEANNSKIDEAYNDLRTNHIDPEGASPLPRTQATLNVIKAERAKAGMTNPSAGLADIENLVSEDRGFNGLVRARSDVGQMVRASKDNPNPGFVPGDFKRIYGAMTSDMENVVRSNALDDPEEAAAALRTANSTARNFIERNGAIQKLLNNVSDEGLMGRLINASRDKTGNVRMLGELRSQLPPEDFNKIAGIALNELGDTDQGFSLARFGTGWSKMSPSAKSVLISDPSHRKALDDIADLGAFLKDADKYRNTSNTAHGAGVAGAIIGGAHLLTSADPHEIAAALAGLAGGYGLGKILGRPASASALRKWLTIARDKASGRYGSPQSAAGNAALSIAGRNLVHNLPERLGGPPAHGKEDKRQTNPFVSRPNPKVQDRYPYPPH